ncbi:MAG: ABC transporter ATP-binding protein [Candidatus Desulfacyla sp.]
MEILQINNLTKSFGKMNALHKVNCRVAEKELLAVIGPNGAGKTTFFNSITGRFPLTEGEILFKGERISGLPTHKIVEKGISRSFQVVNLYPDLTVFSNVRIGVLAHQKKAMRFFRDVDQMSEVSDEVHRILDLVHLTDKAKIVASTLSHGDQKCLEMGMALASHPELLLLDEPTAGMSPEETRYTIELIQDVWKRTGNTIIFTEHDLEMVFAISTRILVLQMGTVIAEGSVEEVRKNPRVQEAYLGEQA